MILLTTKICLRLLQKRLDTSGGVSRSLLLLSHGVALRLLKARGEMYHIFGCVDFVSPSKWYLT